MFNVFLMFCYSILWMFHLELNHSIGHWRLVFFPFEKQVTWKIDTFSCLLYICFVIIFFSDSSSSHFFPSTFPVNSFVLLIFTLYYYLFELNLFDLNLVNINFWMATSKLNWMPTVLITNLKVCLNPFQSLESV